MFQLLFGLGVDTWDVNIIGNALRLLCSMLDRVVYELIVIIYQILFNIADATILSSQFIKSFYSRVQLIIGVFMIFKLAISVLQAVINPDILTDQKKGMGKIITRIITMLVMLTAIIPLNIPNAAPGSYNSYLNQHGLLFGTMYNLQARILDQNTIEKLILGDEIDFSSDEDDSAEYDSSTGIDKKAAANKMATYILKVFIRINLRTDATDEGAANPDNYRCPVGDIDSGKTDVYDVYNKDDVSPGEILDYINTSCYEGFDLTIGETDGKYALAYFPIVPTICGGIILFVLIGFCIDVAIRSIKLAILRLIAPIPIISYIDPASSEKGAFANWVKLLTSTFLNLFIILAIIFFAISIVGKMADSDQTVLALPIGGENGVSIIGGISTVFIIIGVFFFARQAPKFIMDALGIKGMGLGAGLSGVLGAAGALGAGGGLAGALGGFMSAANDASNAAAQGKQAPSAYATQRANMAKMITGDDKTDGSMGYRMQRAMQNRGAARQMNRLYGINAESIKDAKQNMYNTADDLERAKNLYDRYQRGTITDQELSNFANANGYAFDAQNRQLLDAQGNDITSQALENNYLNAQATAGIAKADFDKMQKIGDRANILMTPEQEHHASRAQRREFDRNNSYIVSGYRAVREGVRTGVNTGSVANGLDAADAQFRNTHSYRRDNAPASQSRQQRRDGNNTFNPPPRNQ